MAFSSYRTSAQQIEIWGASTSNSGINSSLIQYLPLQDTLIRRADFINSSTGQDPSGAPIKASNGKIYGVTLNGGSIASGGIFYEYDPITDTLLAKSDLNAEFGIRGPNNGFIEASNGRLYGHFGGVILEYDPAQDSLKQLHQIYAINAGAYHGSELYEARNNKLYGTIGYSSSSTHPSILFEYNPANRQFRSLHTFSGGANGNLAYAGLIEVEDNVLYGTTSSGGSDSRALGCIYSFDLNTDSFQVRYNFIYQAGLGANPEGTLILAPDQKLYGIAEDRLFAFDPQSDSLEVKVDFRFYRSGTSAKANNRLCLADDGAIYGSYYSIYDSSSNSQGPAIMQYWPGSDTAFVAYPFVFDSLGILMGYSYLSAYSKCSTNAPPFLGNPPQIDSLVAQVCVGSEITLKLDSNSRLNKGFRWDLRLDSIHGKTIQSSPNGHFRFQAQTSGYYFVVEAGPCVDSILYDSIFIQVDPADLLLDTLSLCDGSQHVLPDGRTVSISAGLQVFSGSYASSANCIAPFEIRVDAYPKFEENKYHTVCRGGSFQFADGSIQNNLLNNTTYLSQFTSINGCDSNIRDILSIVSIDTSVVLNHPQFSSNQILAQYQWIDCEDSLKPIPGANNRTFTPIKNGVYAVEIKSLTCIDTSTCRRISRIGLTENAFKNSLEVYPNPSRDQVFIENKENKSIESIQMESSQGKSIPLRWSEVGDKTLIHWNASPGIYFLQISSEDGELARFKILRH